MATRLNVTGSVNNTGRLPIEYPPQEEFSAMLTNSIIPTSSVGVVNYGRASTATVVDHEGVIRNCNSGEARFVGARRVENMTGYSETFSNVAWGKIASTIVPNAIAGPTGLGMASSIIEGVGTTQHGISTGTSVSNIQNNTYISSFYAKAGTRNFVQLLISGSVSIQYANFDLINGTFSESSAGVGAMTSVGNGWYRCSIKYTSTSTNIALVYCMIATSLGDPRYPGYTGDGVSNVYVHAHQHEDVTGQSIQTPGNYVSRSILSAPYHGTGADGVKYFDTTLTGAKIPESTLKGFLNEGARTNLLLQSDNLAVTWAGTSASVTIDQAISPDGRMTMDKVVPSAANVAHFISQGITTTANVYAYSIYAKANGYNNIQLWTSGSISNGYVNFNLANGTVGSSSLWTGYIEAFPNGVYRCTAITNTLVATTASFAIGLISSPTAIRADAWIPDGTNGVLVWGVQLELGQNSSSYMPTTTTTATRADELLTYESRNVISNQGACSAIFTVTDSSQFDRRAIGLSVNTTNRLQFQVRRAGLPYTNVFYGDGALVQSVVSNQEAGANNIAFAWTNGVDVSLYMNNTKYTSGAVPNVALTTVDVGRAGGLSMYGCVKNLRLWRKRPTDTELLFLSNQS